MSATIIVNGRIYVERGRFEEALLIEDGFIRAVGTNEAVRAQAPADAAVYDARGRTIVPGFNDSHQHLFNTGIALTDIRLHGARSIEEVKEITRRYIETRRPAPGKVLHGMGWNQDYFEDEHRLLTREDLDSITTEYPLIFERACGHMLTANTAAIELAGLTRDAVCPAGGTIGRDASGELNGIFAENARAPLTALFREKSVDDCVELIRAGMAHAAETGVTSVQTCDLRVGTWQDVLEAYNIVMADNPLTRVYHQAYFNEPAAYEQFVQTGHATGMGTPWHRFGPLKMFVDGSLGARTAFMRQPYADDPSTRGVQTMTDDELNAMVEAAVGNDCSVAIHAIGDGAVEQVLNAYDRVCTGGRNPHRLGIVHVQITDRPLIERFTKNHILAYVQPIFLHYDTRIVEERVGRELASSSYAFATMKNLGIRMSFGTDSPIEDMNPLENLYCAVTRCRLDGTPAGGWHPEEAVDIFDAVDAYTIESAFASFEEDVKGRLLPGYYADLVVLSENIFENPAQTLRSAKVDATMVDGRFVYERAGA